MARQKTLRTKNAKWGSEEDPRFLECSATSEYLEGLSSEYSLYYEEIKCQQLLEKIEDARARLVLHVLQSYKKILNPKQLLVFDNFLQGTFSQVELAEQLNWSGHTVVSYHLYGFKNPKGAGYKRSTRGGAIPTLKQWADKDPTCQKLLLEIKELYNEAKNDKET